MADYSSARHKRDKRKNSNKYIKPSTDSSSDSEPEWVEASPVSKTSLRETVEPLLHSNTQQREDWMLISSNFGPTISRKELQTHKKREREVKNPDRLQLDNPGQHERELNPYWRNGGKGVPNEATTQRASQPASSTSVGDGGVKWLRRAYQRAKEQAEEEGRPLEEVAAERWGSLEKLQQLLESAEEKAKQHHTDRHGYYDKKHDRKRNRYDDDPRRSGKEEYRNEHRFEKHNFDDRRHNRRINENSYKNENRSKNPAWKINNSRENRSGSSSDGLAKEKFYSSELSTSEIENEPQLPSSKMDENINTESPLPTAKPIQMDLNQLSARLLKAELMGNMSLVKELRQQVEQLRSNKFCQKPTDEIVVIRGQGKNRDNKRKKVETHGTDGKRKNYFADDDKYSLNRLFEKEKSRTAHDENLLFAKLMSKGEKLDEDEDVYLGEGSKDKNVMSEAAKEMKRSAALDYCQYCFESNKFPKYLMVAMATKVYLSVPRYESLTEGHCFIIPMLHTTASTHVDEDVWEEIQYFKKALTRMFEATNEDVVFFEMSRNLNSHPHMIIECVPIPRDVGDTAPIYFKKAILDCESEWSHNKKVVDLSTKDVRKAVPKGLPYFAVNFGAEGGFAHVIEDEKLFSKNFAQEIIGGMLDLEPHMWRKPPIQSFDQQQDKAFNFIARWKSFDWTKS